MSEQLALLPGYLTAHIQLTLAALLVGTLVSIPAGVLVHRLRWLEAPLLGIAGVIQTVPSLALLAIMVPLLAALGLPSIGTLPAFLGLVMYSVLPILRNTVTGLAGVDPALIEAARGVGMTPGQRLWRVELPLALPVIIAGLRTSTVWTVGIATLSTPVGAPSLGNYIFSGLQTRNLTAVLVGCVSAAALALILDGLVRLLSHAVIHRQRAITVATVLVLATAYLYAAVTLLLPALERRTRPVRVGAKTFTEQYILSQILALEIREHTGLPSRVVSSLGSTVAFDALCDGDIDLYVDYSGTIWATIMHRTTVPADRAELLRDVEAYLQRQHGVRVVARLGFENAYALAMRRDEARRLRIHRISDLTPLAPQLSMGGDYEFFARNEWKALRRAYGLAFRRKRSMDSALMYQAVQQGEVDVISAFSTDGRLAAYDLVVLEDDRHVIPPYDAIVLASPNLLRRHHEVVQVLGRLTDSIDADHMRAMNSAVDQSGRTPADVARAFVAGLEARSGRTPSP
jgi:osmoprotectant transport system permease protein